MSGEARRKFGRRVALGVIALGAAGAAAFASAHFRQPVREVVFEPLPDVEVGGCAAVRVGPVCELGEDRRLALWVPGDAALTARTDRGPLALERPRIVAGGRAYQVELPEQAGWLSVEAASEPRRSFELELDTRASPAVLERAKQLRSQGHADRAERELAAALPDAPAAEKGRIEGLRARLALGRGEVEQALRLFRRSIAEAERQGHASDVVYDALACAYALTTLTQRFREASELLDRAERWARHFHEGRARVPYYRGLLSLERGDLRSALRELDQARDRADKLSITSQQRNATELTALVLTELGRHDQALALQRTLIAEIEDRPVCERPDVQLNFAWMLLRSRSKPAIQEARRHVDRALALLEDQCFEPFRNKNAELTASMAALSAADPARARVHLERAKKLDLDSVTLRLWQLDLEAEIELASGDPRRAEALFAREAQLALGLGARDAEWRGRSGQGAALAKLGNARAAIDALERAESLLDDLLLVLPLSGGRESFLGERDRSARLLVSLLVKPDPDRAFAVARRARARALRAAARLDLLSGLPEHERRRWDTAMGRYHAARRALEHDARADWSLPADRLELVRSAERGRNQEIERALDDAHAVLAPLAARNAALPRLPEHAGEALLLLFPTERGVIGFFRTHERLVVRETGEPSETDPSALAERVLSPFEDLLAPVRELSLLVSGPLRGVDLHAARVGGQRLLQRMTVTYALDVAPPVARPRREDRALVVADPRGDLPHARSEGALVARALGGARLWSGARASREALLGELSQLDLVHYAGHARFGGATGTRSALLLGGGQELLLGDVLALERVPRVVVLSACEAAETAWDPTPESMSLAHAFVMRGAEVAIAPTRPVSDEVSRVLMDRLYRARSRGGSMAQALGAAQQELAKTRPSADWAAYRALVP